MKSREGMKIIVVLIATMFAVVVVFAYGGSSEPVQTDEPEQREPEIVTMDEPILAEAEALPTWAAMSEHEGTAAFLRQNPQQAAAQLRFGISSATLMWARAQLLADREAAIPPIPQGVSGAELAVSSRQSGAVAGTQILVSGIMTDILETEIVGAGPDGSNEPWVRFNLVVLNDNLVGGRERTDEQSRIYIHVVAPAWAVPVGGGDGEVAPGLPVTVVGRYLGRETMATVTGADQPTPVVVAMRAAPQRTERVESLLGLGRPKPLASDGRFIPDPTIFDSIDDERQVLEMGPYYYLLGQVKVDQGVPGAYADAEDGNQFSEKLHNAPSDYRGQPFTLEGFVWDAWEDSDVAQHQPYDIQRVIRIRMWKRVFGVPHERMDIEGNIEIVNTAFHVYELAVIATDDMTLPEPGSRVRATGRFLKVHGYPRNVSPIRDHMNEVRAQSDGVWFKMFVTSDYDVLPKAGTVDWMQLGTIFLLFSISAALCMMILIGRDEARADDYKTKVKQLRESRRKLRTRTVVTESNDDEPDTEPDTEADQAAASSSEDAEGSPPNAAAVGSTDDAEQADTDQVDADEGDNDEKPAT